jgi:16S rRNA (cytosine967-C5)-methyltransferase
LPETSYGIRLATPVPATQLPGFENGDVSIQDGAAQLAATLLTLAPQQRILDACAAPGGKLTHILELQPDATCIAVEKDFSRLALIKENLQRLRVNADCICQDAANVTAWWDGQLFDRILLDAPCSASGVIRRHPDIKLLRQPTDIPAFAQQQQRLLHALWPLLKPKGLLLYATCSIFPQENTDVLDAFLSTHSDAQEVKINTDWGLPCAIGRQILPGPADRDGFYYARLEKTR